MATPDLPSISPEQRAEHLQWLHEVTQLPTAAGREFRVIRWIKQWAKARRDVVLETDSHGNLHLSLKSDPMHATPAASSRTKRKATTPVRPVYFTAHLDHPAFVVERVIAPSLLELSFRGGVMADYFKDARVNIHDKNDRCFKGRLTHKVEGSGKPFSLYECELDADEATDTSSITLGDVGVWDLPAAEIRDGIFHTLACDDLAAAAAALGAFDVLRLRSQQVVKDATRASRSARGRSPAADPIQPVRVLFTRAEEIGFIGAIAATRLAKETPAARKSGRVRRVSTPIMANNGRIIALENSRSFVDSPIGGGPIVRVGDRISVFSPTLTDAIAKRAEQVAGGPASVMASQKATELPKWKWQRKLMAGGACEASVFFNAGYEATCVCLPLGNYHNMGDLEAVQAGTNTRPATIERECIAVSDFEGLVDLLVACGISLPPSGSLGKRFEKLWDDLSFVLK